MARVTITNNSERRVCMTLKALSKGREFRIIIDDETKSRFPPEFHQIVVCVDPGTYVKEVGNLDIFNIIEANPLKEKK